MKQQAQPQSSVPMIRGRNEAVGEVKNEANNYKFIYTTTHYYTWILPYVV